ncbi:iron ABC transporter substrate-binding protein [Fischerella thermalis CCMEE 5330]|uniref:Iron ABC transporter substrate-binding protein n=1 Tax=Fischerella thermalis CCMEE 5330 TaxID=2019670 RepID=A0A2N6MCT2_9CYAN|nr:ABC transporter substrate-binding protein [Fischerella thermalis]PMB44612.1 iron ABC transporter substrate-binding protein [Fischerella thermalis CCMEE 5330]
MRRSWIIFCLQVFLIVNIVACATTINQQPQKSLTTPTQVVPKKSAKRVVALSTIAADIISQLDQSKLVGMTGSNLFNNNSRFQNIPRINEGRTPLNLEKVIALKPDLVVAPTGFYVQEMGKLQQLGIATYTYNLNSWEALQKLTQALAQLIAADPLPLINRYQSFLANKPNQQYSTLVLVSVKPILSPNKNSWAGDLLAKFKAENVTADLQGQSQFRGYVTLSPEKILQENPEVLILVNTPQPQSKTELLESWQKEPFWQQLQAIKNNRVYIFDYYGLVNAGSIDAIEATCKQLRLALSGQ